MPAWRLLRPLPEPHRASPEQSHQSPASVHHRDEQGPGPQRAVAPPSQQSVPERRVWQSGPECNGIKCGTLRTRCSWHSRLVTPTPQSPACTRDTPRSLGSFPGRRWQVQRAVKSPGSSWTSWDTGADHAAVTLPASNEAWSLALFITYSPTRQSDQKLSANQHLTHSHPKTLGKAAPTHKARQDRRGQGQQG